MPDGLKLLEIEPRFAETLSGAPPGFPDCPLSLKPARRTHFAPASMGLCLAFGPHVWTLFADALQLGT